MGGRDRVSGEHKAVIDLAAAMKKDFGIGERDIQRLTEKEIRKRVQQSRGGSISYPTGDMALHYLYKGAWAWVQKRKWWLFSAIGTSATTCVIWYWSYYVCLLSLGTSHGLFFATCIGSSRRSRLFSAFFFVLISSIALIIMTRINRIHRWTLGYNDIQPHVRYYEGVYKYWAPGVL